jgi:hypothetical protein
MFSWYPKTESIIRTVSQYNDFTAAGVLFTNKKHVLAGWQLKDKPTLTGIGGSRKEGENHLTTAHREMIEELFDVETVPPKLLTTLQTIKCLATLENDSYVNIVYTFDDLQDILRYAYNCGVKTKIYKKFPLTIHDLVLLREPSQASEIQTLAILPMASDIILNSDFQYDIGQLIEAI